MTYTLIEGDEEIWIVKEGGHFNPVFRLSNSDRKFALQILANLNSNNDGAAGKEVNPPDRAATHSQKRRASGGATKEGSNCKLYPPAR